MHVILLNDTAQNDILMKDIAANAIRTNANQIIVFGILSFCTRASV
jgi:hypothetical protein